MKERFTVDEEELDIEQTVEEAFEDNDSIFSFSDIPNSTWESDVVNLNDITVEDDTFTAESNVALHERRVAVEQAQLTVGIGRPLIVFGEDNYLIEGYVRYYVLKDKFETTDIPIYRANPVNADDLHMQTQKEKRITQ